MEYIQKTTASSLVNLADPSLVNLSNMQVTEECAEFTRNDFQEALTKVSKKHTLPFGENIRDTVRAIKGK